MSPFHLLTFPLSPQSPGEACTSALILKYANKKKNLPLLPLRVCSQPLARTDEETARPVSPVKTGSAVIERADGVSRCALRVLLFFFFPHVFPPILVTAHCHSGRRGWVSQSSEIAMTATSTWLCLRSPNSSGSFRMRSSCGDRSKNLMSIGVHELQCSQMCVCAHTCLLLNLGLHK